MAKGSAVVAVADLPYYKPEEESVYVDEQPLVLQPFVAKKWEYFGPSYRSLSNGYASASKWSAWIWDNAQKLPEWFTDEKKIVVTKTVAITIGGMGGYLLGMRRGGLVRRAIYSGTGMAFLAAFCYPEETMDIGRDIADNLKQRWDGTFASYPYHEYPPPLTTPEQPNSKSEESKPSPGNLK